MGWSWTRLFTIRALTTALLIGGCGAKPAAVDAADAMGRKDAVEIGSDNWGSSAIFREVEDDARAGEHGLQYVSPDRAGLGNW